MNRALGTTLAILLGISSLAWGSKSHISPLVGVWTVELSKLELPPEVKPKSVTITFSQPSENNLKTRVEVVGPTGDLLYAEGVTSLDGTPAPVQGNLEADTAAARMPEPSVLVMQLARGNVPGSTRIYTVSKDGKSMTETAANFGDDGRPVMRVNHFKRVK